MRPFINSKHTGYICIHFTDTNERVRFGIDKSWREAGEATLSHATEVWPLELGLANRDEAVRSTLTELAVEAAADPELHRAIPALGYALMLAYSTPCFIIEAERATERPVAVIPIHKTPKQADKWFDALEASEGLKPAIRTAFDGCSEYQVAIPLDPANPTVSPDDLALALPPEIAKAVAADLASKNFQNDLAHALATLATGRKTH
jgi:hypothetical protein